MLSEKLRKLIVAAKKMFISDEERSAQRQSFAYGNTKMHNDNITRELVAEQAQIMDRKLTTEDDNG